MSVSKLTYNSKDYDDEIVAEGGRIEMTHAMAGETLSADSLVPITGGTYVSRRSGKRKFFLTQTVKYSASALVLAFLEYIKNSPGFFYFDNDLLVNNPFTKLSAGPNEHEMIF